MCVCVWSYYGLWMWFPELFERTEDGGSPCANVSRPSAGQNETCDLVKTAAGVFQRIHAHISVFIQASNTAHGGQEISFNTDRSQFLQYLKGREKQIFEAYNKCRTLLLYFLTCFNVTS